METQIPRFYEFGEFKLDSRRRVLTKNDDEIPISAKNYDLLFALLENEGKILSHNELLDLVWGDTFVEQSNLKKGISSLRQILGETPESSLYIKTIPRKGYSFISSVRAYSDEQTNEQFHITATEIIVEEEIIEDDETDILVKPIQTNLTAQKQTKKKNRLFSIAVTSLIFTITIIGIWYFVSNQKPTQFSQLKLENLKPQRLSTVGDIIDITISTEGKFFAYAISEDNNNQSLWLRRLGSMNAIQLIPPTKVNFNGIRLSPDDDFVYYSIQEDKKDVLYKIPILGGTPSKVLENIQSYISFSPDGKKFAFARNKPDVGRVLVVYDLENLSEKEVYHVTDDIHYLIEPKWSPDGKKFAFIFSQKLSDGRVWGINEVSVEGENVKNITIPQKGKIYSLDWLSDGSGLVMTADLNDARQSQLFRIGYPSGEVQRLTNDLLDYVSLCVSNDGKSIVSLQQEKKTDIWVAPIDNLEKSEQITRNLNLPSRFTILPNGDFLAELFENNFQSLSIIDSNGTNPRSFVQQPSVDRFPSVSPDEKSILFISRRSGSDQIWQTDILGNNLQKITDEQTFIINPKFSPDGQSIYFERYNGNRWQLVKIPKTGGVAELISNDVSNNFDFLPDKNLLIYSSQDETTKKGKIIIRNLADKSLFKSFDIDSSSFIRFTPDGKSIIYNTSEIIRDGGNLWLQQIDANSPKPLVELKNEKIYWADFSKDGKKLYFTRGRVNPSAVVFKLE